MHEHPKKRLIIGITGATGVIYGVRLLELLQAVPYIETHVVITSAARTTLTLETDLKIEHIQALSDHFYHINNIAAAISSGSFHTEGMIILPCSIKTLSGIAHSYSDNLLIRAADVCLKERRRLILCVRETPLHQGHLELMLKTATLGATLMPLVPAFYHQPQTIDDLITQSLARVMDQFSIDLHLFQRWGERHE